MEKGVLAQATAGTCMEEELVAGFSLVATSSVGGFSPAAAFSDVDGLSSTVLTTLSLLDCSRKMCLMDVRRRGALGLLRGAE